MSDFCAERALLRGDPMLGTAFPAARLLLVEQPGAWGADAGLAGSRFGPLSGAVEQAAHAAGMRVETIRRPGRSPANGPLRWAVVDTRDGREGVSWGTYESASELLSSVRSGEAPGPSGTEPIYLVCTHGKHDPCCAVRGRPVAAALERLRPGQVFECSHLGGDRFAANVLALPGGLLYGQVTADSVESLVVAAEADEVLAPMLRGRIGLPPAAQAALAFAFEHLQLRQRTSLAVRHSSPIADGVATVCLRGPQGDYEVDVAAEAVAADGLTCGNPRPNRYLRFRPLTVRPVELDATPGESWGQTPRP